MVREKAGRSRSRPVPHSPKKAMSAMVRSTTSIDSSGLLSEPGADGVHGKLVISGLEEA